TSPSATVTPRLIPIFLAVFGRYSQTICPVRASRAKTSCAPVVMNNRPSMTTGVACWEKPGPNPEFRRVIHARLRVLTLDRLIVPSGEYHVLPQSPPTTGQSFAGGVR